jgi:transcriptional regulator with XRE-family HTH domain
VHNVIISVYFPIVNGCIGYFSYFLKDKHMSLVEKVKQLCDSSGTTLTALERELGLSVSSIRKWDANAPSVDKIKAVADYFEVSTDYLLGRTDYKKMFIIKTPPELDDVLEVHKSGSNELTTQEVEAIRQILRERNKG